MNTLHISTHNENCGIGKYQEMYLASMHSTSKTDTHAFFPYSPNVIKRMDENSFQNVLNELKVALKDYDLVHIQHEFSFYQAAHLEAIVQTIKASGLPIVSTIHTSPRLETFSGKLISPKRVVKSLRVKQGNKNHSAMVTPLAQADITIVHNQFTKAGLEEVGFDGDKIRILPIPVPEVNITSSKYDTEVQEKIKQLNLVKGDVLFAAAGYLNDVKGTLQAVKTLRLLPKNYKLLIAGGVHPHAHNDYFFDEVSDYIADNNLHDRVYITGFIKDDGLLNALVKRADIMLYPYGRSYLSSSAALNNAFANHRPIIAFPAKAFIEINQTGNHMILCESFGYYDLAREILAMDDKKIFAQSKISKAYAEQHSYGNMAKEIVGIYADLISNKK